MSDLEHAARAPVDNVDLDRPAPLLDVERLRTEFVVPRGVVRAVDDVSFSLNPGQIMGLVGESGSGKSTVSLSILRLLGTSGRIASGAIRFNGRDLVPLPERDLRHVRGDRIAIVFQDPLTALTPSHRVGDLLVETIMAHKQIPRQRARAQAVHLLERVGLDDAGLRAKQFPHQLSGGMRQRVCIALALCCDPDVLILDEPTTALDVTIQAQILDLLEQLRDESTLSMLFITHDLGVIVRLCDTVSVVYAGAIVEQATTSELLQAPLHPYTKGLLASIPDLSTAGAGRLPYIAGRVPDLVKPLSGCHFRARCPFAEERCAAPQPLLRAEDGHVVACWKHEALRQIPWPIQDLSPRPERAAAPVAPLLSVSRLRKEYALNGFWDSLKIVKAPGRGPRLARVPQKLRAVDDVSLTIAPGETLGLVGESGCGKTTLGRALVRLVTATGGEIHLGGRNAATLSGGELRSYLKDVQIIFQDPDSSLNPRKTIGEVLGRPLRLYGLARGPAVALRVADLLEAVQLSPTYATRYPHQLSGGEKQRIGIARAVAAEPKLIICDEPVSALDVSVRASILNLLDDLKERLGLSYLFISHDLAVVKHISDRIAVMYRGRIVECGTTEEIFIPPYHPYTQALLSAIPIPAYAERSRRRIPLRGTVSMLGAQRIGCNFQDRCPLKLGSICEQVAPPEREVSPGHAIECHHELSFLRTLESPLPAPPQSSSGTQASLRATSSKPVPAKGTNL